MSRLNFNFLMVYIIRKVLVLLKYLLNYINPNNAGLFESSFS